MNATLKTLKANYWEESTDQSNQQLQKIVAEFINGFEALAKVGPCISIFGSARTKPENPYYTLSAEIAEKLAQNGFGVITGGGPGIMEAANRGASKANGKSIGLNIYLPFEQHNNDYIDSDKLLSFDHFFVRKMMFTKYAQGFIMMPGGFGTMDEFFEIATLIQTAKFKQMPMVLVGRKYWGGLMQWIEEVMLAEGNISPEDLTLIDMADTADEVIDCILDFYRTRPLAPNF